MLRHIVITTVILGSTAISGRAAGDDGFKLVPPLACDFGRDCFIQQYPDHDPGPGAQDYRCGGETYQGHDGTDFRIVSARLDVKVVAAAAGRVKRVRDGAEDDLVETAEARAKVRGRECGNGIVIEHAGGWETYYCHLRRGSIAVRPGQAVDAGAPLGLVGYSGEAQFPHVHLTVLHDGRKIDPFAGDAIGSRCDAGGGDPAGSLWSPEARERLAYRDAVIIETGFAARPFTPAQGELGQIDPASAAGEALLFYGRLINLRQGDRLRITLSGPGGFSQAQDEAPFDRNKARHQFYYGRKRPGERWPAGVYRGTVDVIRSGATVSQGGSTIEIR